MINEEEGRLDVEVEGDIEGEFVQNLEQNALIDDLDVYYDVLSDGDPSFEVNEDSDDNNNMSIYEGVSDEEFIE